MRIGFTGTRTGLSDQQVERIIYYLSKFLPGEVHHGLCIGADAYFHRLVSIGNSLNFVKTRIIGHPPIDKTKYCHQICDEYREDKPYLDRNHDIVDETDILIACPAGQEKLRSGTWATIRYAKSKNKEVYICYP